MTDVADALFKVQAETEVAAREADSWYEHAWESVKSSVKEGFSQVWNPVVEELRALGNTDEILLVDQRNHGDSAVANRKSLPAGLVFLPPCLRFLFPLFLVAFACCWCEFL